MNASGAQNAGRESLSHGAGISSLVQQAESLRSQGALGDAAALLERALALEPRSYEARLMLAQICEGQARYADAAAHLKRLTFDYADKAVPWWLLGLNYRNSGNSPDALACIDRHAALCPQDLAVQLRCAEFALDLGDEQRGLSLIGRARAIDPENGVARFLEGRVFFENGDTERSIAAYHDAARIAPRLGEAHGGRLVEAWMMSFPSWARDRTGACRILAPAYTLNIPPASVIPREETQYWPAHAVRVPEVFFGTIEGAEVLPPEFPVLAPDGCFFLHGFVTSPDGYAQKMSMAKFASSDGRLLLDLPKSVLNVEGPAILLARSNNYFHFLFETLARIWGVEQLGIREAVPALVPRGLYQTELELLALLGFPAERLIEVPAETTVRCGTLYAPSLLGQGYAVSPIAVQYLRERVLARLPEVSGLPKRIYLSRNRMPRRHVVNERELVPTLEKHGFALVHPETLGVAEQIRMFAAAEAILTPDSSALANLAFASRGAEVGVLNWRGLHKPLWHCIAFHAGANLTYIHVDSLSESSIAVAHRDMRVDPVLLDAWLATL
jgi:tetratricopeptide (TPR) repeat protein